MKAISKLIQTIFLIYLIFSSSVTSMKIRKWRPTDPTVPVDAGKMAGTCLKALMENIPPDFCWKKGADFGKIPTGCPPGYFRSLALCYQNCDNGYTFFLGVCWATCESGYDDHGATCYKSFFRWYFKHSYIPRSLTNFSSEVPCPKGMYRSLALCYRNCEHIAMENCGIGACSASKESCASSIVTMAVDVLSGIADAVMFVVSFGSTSALTAAKNSVKNAVKKVGKAGLKAAFGSITKYFKSKFKDQLLKNAAKSIGEYLKDTSKDLLVGKLTESAITNICKSVWDSAINKSIVTPDINFDTITDSLDVFNAKGIMTSCDNTSEEGAALDCAANIVGGLSAIDPTGLLTIASAFMHPVCEVPQFVDDTVEEDYSEIEAAILAEEERIKISEDGCIFLYKQCDYKEELKVCDSLTVMPEGWNDAARSMKVGSRAKGLLYEHQYYSGNGLLYGPGAQIPCFKDVKLEGISLDVSISSILFGGQDCMFFDFNWDYNKATQYERFCGSSESDVNFHFNWEDMKFFEYKTYNPYLKTIFYAGKSFTGQTWEVSGINLYESPDAGNKPMDTIGSFRNIIISQDGVGYVRYVEVEGSDTNDFLSFSQIVVLDEYGNNISTNRPVSVTSNHHASNPANIAVDGNEKVRNFPEVYHSANTRGDKFTIDLRRDYYVKTIKIYGRGDCCHERIKGAKINLYDSTKYLIHQHVIEESSKEIEINFSAPLKTQVVKKTEASKNTDNIRYVRLVAGKGGDNFINISQIVVRNEILANIAEGKPVTATSSHMGSNPQKIVDGIESNRNHPDIFHSARSSGDEVTIDLQANSIIASVEIYNRKDCCTNRIVGAKLQLLNAEKQVVKESLITEDKQKIVLDYFVNNTAETSLIQLKKVRYVKLQAPYGKFLTFSQLVVRDETGANVAKGKPVICTHGFFRLGFTPVIAVDGNESSRDFPYIYHSLYRNNDFYMVDLQKKTWVKSIEIFNRSGNGSEIVGAKYQILDPEQNVIREGTITNDMQKIVFNIE
jgi:hypothetical protein